MGLSERDMAAKAQLLCEAVGLEDRGLGMALVEELLAEGVDPNAVGFYGERPLHVAVWAGHWEAASQLLDAGGRIVIERGLVGDAFVRLMVAAPEPLLERVIREGPRWEDLIKF